MMGLTPTPDGAIKWSLNAIYGLQTIDKDHCKQFHEFSDFGPTTTGSSESFEGVILSKIAKNL